MPSKILVIMSACHHVSLSSCQLVIMSTCHHMCLSALQFVNMSTCQHVNLSTCQPVNMSTHLIKGWVIADFLEMKTDNFFTREMSRIRVG